MKIYFISPFSTINKESSRLSSIYNRISGEKKVITTDFNHSKKCYLNAIEKSLPNQLHIHVPRYKSNIGIKRIFSHFIFALKLKIKLSSLEERPDVIYCTMPTSSAAYVCARFCRKKGVKFIIDVIDLWPDSLLPLVKGKSVIKAFLLPWTFLSHYAYKNADVIIAESIAYANEAKKNNNKASTYPIYLGVDSVLVNKVKLENPIKLKKPDGEIWIAYAGSLGKSYDFNVLLDSIRSIHSRFKYKLWFIGDGVMREMIDDYIHENQLNAEITGFLSYEDLLGYLEYCDIAINIFRHETKVVYSYKFNDYVAMNCFVLNSLEGETADMVDYYKIGRNFNFTDKPLSVVLEDVLNNWHNYHLWKLNCDNLINDKLDKDKAYAVVGQIFKTKY